jgi:hypothetical protein
MDQINLIKNLIRLAQISEEIEESNPDAAGLIDDTINDAAKDAPDTEPQNIDPDLYPSVQTPFANIDENPESEKNILEEHPNENKEIASLAKEIAFNLINSGELDKIIPDLENDHGGEILDQLVEQKVEEALQKI